VLAAQVFPVVQSEVLNIIELVQETPELILKKSQSELMKRSDRKYLEAKLLK